MKQKYVVLKYFTLAAAVCFVTISAVLSPNIIIFVMCSLITAVLISVVFISVFDEKTDEYMTKKILNDIKHFENVYLMGHKRADFDSFGACIGMYALCRQYDKRANIILGEDILAVKEIYNKFLCCNNYKNVFITSAEANKKINNNTLVILCDTHTLSIVDNVEILNKAKKVIVIDHHKESECHIKNEEDIFIKPNFSSTCEIVALMLKQSASKIYALEAEALLAGIVVDTKNFAFNSGESVFLTAAYLCKNGAQINNIRLLFKNSINIEKAKANAVENSKMYKNGIIFSFCNLKSKDVYVACAIAADELLDIRGVEASIVMCEYENVVFVSARSGENIDVESILKKVGGGGHCTMAGAQINNTDINKVYEMLKNAVDEYLAEVK